ncbi:putative gustatory receptor 28b isoform X3 [Aedes aegypti]|uniref:Gustatory receptor n=1 Tax=Aedes aegypti TaxID=7159 RepID=A0A6I8U5T1_AEDAE|nr:putative gustatory receptor 28b isoform X3 [Aedes aegypti]
MKWFQAYNFFDSFRPVYLATKLFHVHFETLDFKRQTVGRTLIDQFRFILSLLLDISFLFRSFTANLPYLYLTESVLLNVGNYLSLMLLATLTYTLSLWNHCKSKEIFQLCASINDCDRKLEKLGIPVDHRRHHFASTLSTGVWMCFSVIITLNAVSVRRNKVFDPDRTDDFEAIIVVAIFRISTNFSLFVCYTSLTLFSINGRLAKLQAFLATTALPTSGSSKRICQTIRRIAAVHDQLSDTIRMFNDCYSVHTMYGVIASSSFSVFVVFGLIHAYASNVSEVTMQIAWRNMLYDLFYVLMLAKMLLSTSLVSRNVGVCKINLILEETVLSLIFFQCKRMAHAIHKAICYRSYDKQIFNELGRFSQQLEHNAPKISCGLFDFDWTLLYSIAGSFATYLVILLQFDLVNLNFVRE